MDICSTENCGSDAADECEGCGKFFCKQHGSKDNRLCSQCKEKEEGGEDLDLF